MLHLIFEFGFLGLFVVLALLAGLVRSKRGILGWAAASMGAASVAARYDVFWAMAVFSLTGVWALFCLTSFVDFAWRVKTGFVLFLTLGSVLCFYPTYHDERYGPPAVDADQSSDQPSDVETKAKHGDLGLSRYILANVPFRLVRGLDLKGGARMVYGVEVERAIEDKRDSYYDELRQALAVSFGFHTGEGFATVEELSKLPTKARIAKSPDQPGVMTLTLNDAADSSKINDELLNKTGLRGLQVQRSADQKTITFRISSQIESEIRDKSVAQAKETVRKRVDEFGLKDPTVVARDEQIVIEIPGEDQKAMDRIKDTISQTARLEFKMVDDNVDYFENLAHTAKPADLPKGLTFSQEDAPIGPKRTKPVFVARLVKSDKEKLGDTLNRLRDWIHTLQVDPDHEIGVGKVEEYNEKTEQMEEVGWRTYYLFRKAEVTGDMVQKAEAKHEQGDRVGGGWIVALEFNSIGADRFEDVTGKNVGRRFAIILDNKVESAPRIINKIGGGRCQITMGSSAPEQQLEQSRKLEVVLRSGALPAPISHLTDQFIGPSLGQDAIGTGLRGAAGGMVLVLIFMVVYYSRAGMIANIAVMFNLMLQMTILAMFSASMTLPGIAGLALTIGIAVDANVLINERIREELRQGKSPRAAVDVGYEKAFSAIVDGHVTTLLSSVILWQFGTGPIQGFALTLFAGVLVSLFTGVVCTRLMFDYAVRGRKIKRLYLG